MKCNCLLILFIIINKTNYSIQELGSKIEYIDYPDNYYYPDITDYADTNQVKYNLKKINEY